MECVEYNDSGVYSCGVASAKGGSLNQDRYRVTPDGVLLVDGIGGLSAGEVFAEVAAWKGGQLLSEKRLSADEVLCEASRVTREVEGALCERGGAAACAVKFGGTGGLDIACQGDVRAFLLDENRAWPLTSPDVNGQGRLINYVGSRNSRGGETVSLTAEEAANKTLMLATDGAWKYLPLQECVEINRRHASPCDAARSLVELALACASPDDATVVVCRPQVRHAERLSARPASCVIMRLSLRKELP